MLLISNNTFSNLSFAGAIVHLEETINRNEVALALHKNSFRHILGYSGPTILRAKRSLYNSQLSKSAILSGGKILLEENDFSEIVGCQASVSSLLTSINVDTTGLSYTSTN